MQFHSSQIWARVHRSLQKKCRLQFRVTFWELVFLNSGQFLGSLSRLQSIDSAFVPTEITSKTCWVGDPAAWDYFCSLLTCLYGLFLIVFAIVMELSQKLMPDGWLIEMFFNTYMYGAGIAFLAHCYLFQIHPGWFNFLMKMAQRRNWIESSSVCLAWIFVWKPSLESTLPTLELSCRGKRVFVFATWHSL